MRLSRTLLVHITIEFWKLLLVTTAVLLAVIAFAVTVKPLADGKLQPLEALKFMGLASFPMLAYALPFAACFSATLVYHRLASENEAQAAASGGISHRSLLLPALVTGVVLAIGLSALHEVAIPRFLRSMERLVKADTAELLVRMVRRGEAVQLGGRWIYADWAQRVAPPAGSTAVDQIVLKNAVLISTDKDFRPITEGTAELVAVGFYKMGEADAGGSRMRVVLRAKNMVGRERDRAIVRQELVQLPTFDVPSLLEDNPKFLTWSELRGLRTKPEAMNFIERRRALLALEIARADSLEGIKGSLADRGVAEFVDNEGRALTVRGTGIVPDPEGGYRIEAPAGTSIETRRTPGAGAAALRTVSPAARLIPTAPDELSTGAVQFKLELSRPETFSGDGSQERAGGSLTQLVLAGLRSRTDMSAALSAQSGAELLRTAGAGSWGPGAASVQSAAADLQKKTDDLAREVTSKQHERLAQSACCLIMVLTGAVVALRFSQRQPLTVYLWSFLPALVGLVSISGGQQLAHTTGHLGLVLLWGGLAVLLVYTLSIFRVVARH